MRLKVSQSKKLYIIRPEIEIEYTKHPMLGRLYIVLNYWRFIKIGRCEIISDYKKICFFCGKPAECEHHLLFGNGIRPLAEADGLKVPSCHKCHNLGKPIEQVHDNPMAEKLSKMLGQAIFEHKIGTREEFRNRYGKSYL